jgi:hypothetical protein
MAHPPAIEIGLIAAIVAATDQQPLSLIVADQTGTSERGGTDGLPYGPFDPLAHRTFEVGLRSWVHKQTALTVGHVEQLYTFGDRGRQAAAGDGEAHQVSVVYLALTRIAEDAPGPAATGATGAGTGVGWRSWYDYFPWEDWREGRPAIIDEVLIPALVSWIADDPGEAVDEQLPGRRERVRIAFGLGSSGWDDERALDRYEILYEAGLITEALRDSGIDTGKAVPALGRPMRFDHRRILATAISRLRAKLKYRPVIFELMSDEFTLTELQRMAEAISGRHLHQQNFRRLVDNAALLEPTGAKIRQSRGRPAALFRFRHEILKERPAPGLRLGVRG